MNRTIDAKSPGEPKAINFNDFTRAKRQRKPILRRRRAVVNQRRKSALSLLMTRVLADDEQNAATLHELAFIADLLNAGTDFHDLLSRLGAIQSIAVYEESARIHKGLEHEFRHSHLIAERRHILPKPPAPAFLSPAARNPYRPTLGLAANQGPRSARPGHPSSRRSYVRNGHWAYRRKSPASNGRASL